MKPYEQLSRLGKIRRMRGLVIQALEGYDLDVESVRFLTIDTNTTFKLHTIDGERFVFRIYSDEDTAISEIQAEMFWLQAILRDTDINIAEPVPTKDGNYWNVVSKPGLPAELPYAIFKWVPGQELENYLSPKNYYKLGQLMARLHQHAAALNPLPPDILPKKWDKIFYFPDEPVVYNKPEYSYLFPPERIALMEAVIERADELFARLYADEDKLILIHGDLHFWNVHYHRGELYLMDFGDISLGFPEQDIAITLYYGRGRDGYEEWKAAFREGYSSVLPWPVEDDRTIETLMAARSVNFINYVARIDEEPDEIIDRLCSDLTAYLDSSRWV